MSPFADDTLRAEYAEETLTLCQQGAEAACRLAIPIVLAFSLLDFLVFPDQALVFLVMRAVAAAAVAGILAVLHTEFGRRHALGLGVCVTVLLGLTIDVMTVFTGREASPYYAGTNLVLLATALLMPWPAIWTTISSGSLVAVYVLLILATGPIANGRIFLNNLAFLMTTAVISVVSTAMRERLRAREFVNRAALADALRHKSEFMAKMSHELRTPLHVMIGYADILLEDDHPVAGTTESRRLVERIRSRGVLLHRMISDLLDYAKIEAGKMEVHWAPVAMEQVVAQVADGFRPLAERKRVALDVRCDDAPAPLVTDAPKVEQILTNLIGNALKFTEHGRVSVAMHPTRSGDALPAPFTVLGDPGRSQPQGAGVLIVVEDTGIGIRPGDVARLATDFQQANDLASKFGGTGLGLSISRRLAEMLGGWIAVRSDGSPGAAFALWLPASAAPLLAAA